MCVNYICKLANNISYESCDKSYMCKLHMTWKLWYKIIKWEQLLEKLSSENMLWKNYVRKLYIYIITFC